MKAGDFIAKLAAKSGINLSDEKNKDFATAIAAMTAEISEEAASKMSGSLMNMDDARNNIDLKKYFTAAVYDGMDSEINNLMDEMGFELQDKEVVKAEQSTTKKQGALARQIKALEEKKSASKGQDRKDLQEQINQKTSQIVALQKTHDEQIKTLNTQWEQKFTETQIRSILNGKTYANKELPLDVNVETAIVIANRKLQESGAKIVNVNGSLVLKQLKDQDLDWISPTNEKPSVENFLDGVLASSKLLAVTHPAGTPQNVPGSYVPPTIPGGQNGGANQTVLSSMNEDFKAAEAAFAN